MRLFILHFSISVLCLLAFIGIEKIFKEQIKASGYLANESKTTKKKKNILSYWIFFIPIYNVVCIIAGFICMSVNKYVLNEWYKKYKEQKGHK